MKQKDGKVVHAWAFEGDADPGAIRSNSFQMQWPRGSGQWRSFPEVDRVQWFDLGEARRRINPRRRGSSTPLRDGQRRELYGIGPRHRAFRGDERAIGKALVDDARGLRNPVYFRFLLTVDDPAAERLTRLDGWRAERVLPDAVRAGWLAARSRRLGRRRRGRSPTPALLL